MTRLYKSKWAYVAACAFFAVLSAVAWARCVHPGAAATRPYSNTESLIYLLVPFMAVLPKFNKTQNILEKSLVLLTTLELVWMHLGAWRFHAVRWCSPAVYWMICFVLLTSITLGLALRTIQIFRALDTPKSASLLPPHSTTTV